MNNIKAFQHPTILRAVRHSGILDLYFIYQKTEAQRDEVSYMTLQSKCWTEKQNRKSRVGVTGVIKTELLCPAL